MTEVVKVGDRIRFTVALLRDLEKLPEHRSFLVEVAEVRVEDDGGKILVLHRLDFETIK
jgi:hypothetical protein